MKKRSVILLCVAMVLTACGMADPPPKHEEASRGDTAQSEEEMPMNATRVDFWFAGSVTPLAVMRDIVDTFNGSQETYYVKMTTFETFPELYRRVNAAIATDTAPDVVVLERDPSNELRQKGLTVDLTQVLRRDANFDPSRFLPVYYNQGLSGDGNIFAMPLYGTTHVMYYNKAAFAAAGIAPADIHTWRDLAAAAAAIRDTELYEYGWEPMWGHEGMVDAALSNGGTIYSEDGRTVTINAPEWVEVWEAFRQWIHEEKTMRIHSGGYGWESWDYTRKDVLEGRAGGYTGSSGDQADLDFGLVGMMEQPAWDDGDEARPGARALLLNVLSTSELERQTGAYALIRYLIDVPAQVRWTVGTGYIAVNQGVLDDAEYQSHLSRNPDADVPLLQSAHASAYPPDPTGGVIREAIVRAADRIQIENLPAREVLDEAQITAQKALDAILPPISEPVQEGGDADS